MANDQQKQGASKDQSSGAQNPTLNQPGTQVADYGNVTGGSSDENVEEGQQEGRKEENKRSESNETIGNP